jgi:hypothetical protein
MHKADLCTCVHICLRAAGHQVHPQLWAVEGRVCMHILPYVLWYVSSVFACCEKL